MTAGNAEYVRLRRRFVDAFISVLAPYYPEEVSKRTTVAFHLADEAFLVLLQEIERSDAFESPSAGWNDALAAIQDAFSAPAQNDGSGVTTAAVPYDRDVLVDVLVHHWPNRSNGCECGWSVLGASYPGHIADVYEASVRSESGGT